MNPHLARQSTWVLESHNLLISLTQLFEECGVWLWSGVRGWQCWAHSAPGIPHTPPPQGAEKQVLKDVPGPALVSSSGSTRGEDTYLSSHVEILTFNPSDLY